jgi:hypothetical protein
MSKEPRKPEPPATQLLVLDRSRRRCALCFHLRGDLTEKKGQIAHLDDDRTNFAEANLAWLCLDHHDGYDSRTSQSKNYTMVEVKKARDDLYKAIEQGKHLSTAVPLVAGRETDRHTYESILAMFNGDPIYFLRTHDFGYIFAWSCIQPVVEIAAQGRGVEYEFLDPTLEEHRQTPVRCANELGSMLAANTWPLQSNAAWSGVPWTCPGFVER